MKPSVVKINGAGLKGLTLAYFLKQRGIKSELFEISDRAGGWIKTIQTEDFLFEAGPRGFRPHPITLSLVDSLNLKGELIAPDKAAKKRFIYYKGALRGLSYFTPQLLYGVMRDLVMPANSKPQSIRDYFTYRMGKFCTETFVDAFSSGIYGGDIAHLSAQGCFPQMTSQRSIIQSLFSQPRAISPEPLFSFKKGMETLTQALMKDQVIHYNQTCPNPDIDASPSPNVSSVSLITVNVGWKKQKMTHSGFGYLIPQKEKEPILGTVFDSITFPEQNQKQDELRLTMMMGGAHHPYLMDYSDEQISAITLQTLSRHLNITAHPDALLIHRAYHAIPQPVVNGLPVDVGVNNVIKEALRLSETIL